MLHDYLLEHREAILRAFRDKAGEEVKSAGSRDLMDRGIAVFFDELVEMLRREAPPSPDRSEGYKLVAGHAAVRGKESLRLGYTLSQLVRGYGRLGQTIVEYAAEHGGDPIPAKEFGRLNRTLDAAVAEAVGEFNSVHREAVKREELLRLGARTPLVTLEKPQLSGIPQTRKAEEPPKTPPYLTSPGFTLSFFGCLNSSAPTPSSPTEPS